MSIAMERPGINERLPEFRVSSGRPNPTIPYRVECHNCGFEASDLFAPPLYCPRCMHSAWERFVLPGSLLMNNDQYYNTVPHFNHRS